jgi:uncharacterized RDD family membrane protein YckC
VSPAAAPAVSPWSIAQRPRDRSGECDPARRVGARIIDFLVLMPVLVATLWHAGEVDLSWAERSVSILAGAVYEVCLTAWRGQTLGKLLVHVRVVAADGRRVTAAQSLVRYLALVGPGLVLGAVGAPDLIALPWNLVGLGMLLVHGLGPHDYIARTKVVLDADVNRS